MNSIRLSTPGRDYQPDTCVDNKMYCLDCLATKKCPCGKGRYDKKETLQSEEAQGPIMGS